MIIKTFPCIWLAQENWAASFVKVQEIFADPHVEGVTEVQCNVLPCVWISHFPSLQMNINILHPPFLLERKLHKIIPHHILSLSWQNPEKCSKFKWYGICRHSLSNIKLADQNQQSLTKESPKRSFIFLIPFPCLHLFLPYCKCISSALVSALWYVSASERFCWVITSIAKQAFQEWRRK